MALEPLETRYTSQWISTFPKQIETFLGEKNLELQYNIVTLIGNQIDSSPKTSEGAFLNFIDTNYWKNTQINRLIQMIQKGQVHKKDKVIFMDAWHSGILQTRYMSDLLELELEIHSIWHAGSYDPQDFLGRKIQDKRWSFNAERSYFFASTKNYFATEFHLKLIQNGLGLSNEDMINKAYHVGFPFDYLQDICKHADIEKKEDIILFPHRITSEKQPEIFEDLANSLPEYKFVFCQKEHLTKEMYYDLLKRAKVVFSANLQETLGISCYEGMLCNCLPLVPDRLSYSEMYLGQTYDPTYTESYESYLKSKTKMIIIIRGFISYYDEAVRSPKFNEVKEHLKKYFTSTEMLKQIFNL